MECLKLPYVKVFNDLSRVLLVLLAFLVPTTTAGTNIAFYTLLGLFLLSGDWRNKWLVIQSSRLVQATLLLLVFIWLGTLYGSVSWHEAASSASKFNKLLLIPIVLYLFQEQKWVKRSLYAFLLASFLTLFFGALKFYFHLPVNFSHLVVGLPASPFIWHIGTNFMMAFATVILGYLTWQQTGKQFWLFAVWTLLTLHYVLFMNIARSGYVVLLVMGLVLIAFYLGQKAYKKAIVTFIILALGFCSAAVFSPTFNQRIQAAQSNVTGFQDGHDATSVGARLAFYKGSLHIVREHPVVGVGTGSFAPAFTQMSKKLHLQVMTVNPHNQYLDITTQLGLVGLLILLYFFWSGYASRNRKNELSKVIGLTVLAGMMAGSLVNSWLMDLHPGFFYCLMIALSAVGRKVREIEKG